MIKSPFDKFLLFDVESVGLHGRAFAVGYCVFVDGIEIGCGEIASEPSKWDGSDDDLKWVEDHVTAQATVCRYEFGRLFWEHLQAWKMRGFAIVSDCAWPVEARFLCDLIDIDKEARNWQGPYPLYDVSSVLAALGYDPIGTYPRKDNELPAHNPLCDARQSARVLIEALNGTLEKP